MLSDGFEHVQEAGALRPQLKGRSAVRIFSSWDGVASAQHNEAGHRRSPASVRADQFKVDQLRLAATFDTD
jgi:hypothetical protein